MGTLKVTKTKEFLGGYAAGIDDAGGMSATDIVRVAEGNMRMSRMVHYYLPGARKGEIGSRAARGLRKRQSMALRKLKRKIG